MPDVAVPLATYTGWNFRQPSIGAPERIVPLPAATSRFRGRKPSVRHNGTRGVQSLSGILRAMPIELISQSAAALVKDRFLLEEDTIPVNRRAADHWDSS